MMNKELGTKENELAIIIGNNIKSYRKTLGLTQGELADFLSVTSTMISYYEKGSRDINMENLQKLADLFNIELSDLLENNSHIIELNAAVAFKRDSLKKTDLEAIAKFRRIVKNYIKLSNNE